MMNNIPIFDPMIYNNKVLTDNIMGLSSLFHQFTSLQLENNNLKSDNTKITEELNKVKKELELLKIVNRLEQMNKPVVKTEIKKENNFKIILQKPHKNSWSEEKVNNIISQIKSNRDIILLLKGNLNEIKHNTTLQRLIHLIKPLEKLENMVGLEDIKKDVFKKIIYHIMNPTNNEDYLNTIISGPPGVGKTEFAKIYGEIFVNLGILKNNNFIQIKRDDLVGKYLGETSMKTKQILENAIGGVLFLDEAYSLGNTEKRDSFSKEAIDMINVYLSEKKGQFMFIIAGYMDDIESCFFAYNKGLKRRFHSHYNITGYNPNEMKDIFIRKVIENKYNNMVASNTLLTFFTENMKRFNYFAGDIEKLFNEIKQCQALRIFNTNKISKDILYEDITAAIQEKLFEKREEPPFGMYS